MKPKVSSLAGVRAVLRPANACPSMGAPAALSWPLLAYCRRRSRVRGPRKRGAETLKTVTCECGVPRDGKEAGPEPHPASTVSGRGGTKPSVWGRT